MTRIALHMALGAFGLICISYGVTEIHAMIREANPPAVIVKQSNPRCDFRQDKRAHRFFA